MHCTKNTEKLKAANTKEKELTLTLRTEPLDTQKYPTKKPCQRLPK